MTRWILLPAFVPYRSKATCPIHYKCLSLLACRCDDEAYVWGKSEDDGNTFNKVQDKLPIFYNE